MMKDMFPLILKQRNKDCPKYHPYTQAGIFLIKEAKEELEASKKKKVVKKEDRILVWPYLMAMAVSDGHNEASSI
jgi:hypothetical protein